MKKNYQMLLESYILFIILATFLVFKSSCCMIDGKMLRQKIKSEKRMNMLAGLLSKEYYDVDSKKAMRSLLQEDTYDSKTFSDSHLQFKSRHNSVFIQLAKYCSIRGISSTQVFYLDGIDGATTEALRNSGFNSSNLYIANLFHNTANILKNTHLIENTFIGRAEDILLLQVLKDIPFAAYYFDGCGGSATPIIAMIRAIFSHTKGKDILVLPLQFAVGITLTEADPDRRHIADREQDITRYLSNQCHINNYNMEYVGDQPEKYNLFESPPRREGSTQTTWFVIKKASS